MLSDARLKRFDAIVLYDLTRGSRDIVDWFTFRNEMRDLGIRVVSIHDHLGDISQPGDFLQELITVGIGQHQVLTTRQKSIDGKRNRAKEGKFCGGVPPLGYDIVDGRYVINEREARVIRTIFEMYGSGKSYFEILDYVHTTGIRRAHV